MNKITIIGNLANNAELRQTSKGTPVCSFTVAVNRRRKVDGQPEADFFRVTTWNKLAEICQSLEKGQKVAVTGAVSVSTYEKGVEKRFTLELTAEDVEFLSPRNKGVETPQKASEGYVEVEDSDLPF